MNIQQNDAIRIAPYCVLTQSCPEFGYREADTSFLSSFRGGSISPLTTLVQAHLGFGLLTLASEDSHRKTSFDMIK